VRKKFLKVVLAPLVILTIIVYIFIDSWITSGIEYAGEQAIGAKVDIEGLHLHLFPLGIEWDKMEVANPNNTWTNLFETGKITFLMDPGQLLRGKYIINIIEVKDFVLGTKRKTDGALPGLKTSSNNNFTFSNLAENAFKNTVTTTPLFDLAKLKNGFDADSLIRILDLKSFNQIDTLKNKIDRLSGQWKDLQTDMETQKNKVLDIEKQIKAIDPSKLNNLQNLTSAITTVNNAKLTLDEINKFISDKTLSLENNIVSVTGSAGMIKNYVSQDFDRLKNMARLPSINTSGMAQLLVGNEMLKRSKNYLYWVDAARANIKKYSPDPDYTYPPRFSGQDIRYPEEHSYPKFWVKKIVLSGGTDKSASDYIRAKGNAENITSNQQLTGSPMTIALEGTANEQRTLKLGAKIDRRKEISKDEFNVGLYGVPVSDFSLGSSNFLPTKITHADMDTRTNLVLNGNKIDVSIQFDLKSIDLKFQAEPKNIVERLFRQVLQNVKDFNIGLHLWNTNGPFNIAINTNLDEILAQKVSDVVGQEIGRIRSDLKNKFDAVVKKQVDDFNNNYLSKLDQINKQLSDYNALLTDQLNLAEKKKQELLEKQKKGFLEGKLKDFLK